MQPLKLGKPSFSFELLHSTSCTPSLVGTVILPIRRGGLDVNKADKVRAIGMLLLTKEVDHSAATVQETTRAAGKRKAAPKSRKTVSKPVKEGEGITDGVNAKVEGSPSHEPEAPIQEEEVAEPSKSAIEEHRDEELPAELAAAKAEDKSGEGATAPSRRKTGTRDRKTSSKLKEAIADSTAPKSRVKDSKETEEPGKRKAAPKSKKSVSKATKAKEGVAESTAAKRREGSKEEEEEEPAKKKMATKVCNFNH